jgi:hypothetical protein
LLSHTYNSTIDALPPIDALPLIRLTGSTIDISPLLHFHFWDHVYYHKSETSFPLESNDGLGYIIGISEHCGNAITYKVLTADTGMLFTVPSSVMRALMTLIFVPAGEPITHEDVVKSRHDFSPPDMGEYIPATMPSPSPAFNPQDLFGCSFLMDKQPDGQRPRGTLVQMIEDHESSLKENPTSNLGYL